MDCEHSWKVKVGLWVDLYFCTKCGVETRTRPIELDGEWDANDLPL